MFGTKTGNKIKYKTNFGALGNIYLWFDYTKKVEKIEHMKQLMHTMMQCNLETTLHKKTQYWNPIAIDILNLFFLQCNKEIPYPKKLSADLRPQNSFTCYHFFTKNIDKLTSSITAFILETCEAIKKECTVYMKIFYSRK